VRHREPSPARARGPPAAAAPARMLAPAQAALMPCSASLIRGVGPTAAPALNMAPAVTAVRIAGGKPPKPDALSALQMAVDNTSILLPSGRSLEIIAQAKPVNSHPVDRESPDSGACAANIEELSSDDETPVVEGEDRFDYREYRYKAQETRKAPAPGVAVKRGKVVGRPMRDWSPLESGLALAPWGLGVEFGRWKRDVDPLLGQLKVLTPVASQDEAQDPGLERIAKAVITFYGLPNQEASPAIRLRWNSVMVDIAAWTARRRDSQLEAPPMFWLRGGRIYDFHGDRGTLAEFEHDFLVRKVEDDSVCRMRRREQGLMPFPFVAAPLTQKDEEDDADDKPDSRGRRRH